MGQRRHQLVPHGTRGQIRPAIGPRALGLDAARRRLVVVVVVAAAVSRRGPGTVAPVLLVLAQRGRRAQSAQRLAGSVRQFPRVALLAADRPGQERWFGPLRDGQDVAQDDRAPLRPQPGLDLVFKNVSHD